jgi:hypothetical protein
LILHCCTLAKQGQAKGRNIKKRSKRVHTELEGVRKMEKTAVTPTQVEMLKDTNDDDDVHSRGVAKELTLSILLPYFHF